MNILQKKTFALLRQKKYKQAESAARDYIEMARNNMQQHYAPMNWENSDLANLTGIEISRGYRVLSQIMDSVKNLESALSYIDSATFYFKGQKNAFNYERMMNKMWFRKALLLSRLDRPRESLSSYESLYREFQDDNLWDSVKVLFERHPELGDFKTYQQELRKELGLKEEILLKAPEFSAQATDGNTYNLSDWQGTIVVLNFWGSYCLPCARELPELNALQRAFANEDVLFLGPTKDKTTGIERFETRQPEGFSFPSVPEAQDLFDAFEIRLVPTQIIINQQGEIIHRQEGAVKGSVEELGDVIQKALDGNS